MFFQRFGGKYDNVTMVALLEGLIAMREAAEGGGGGGDDR